MPQMIDCFYKNKTSQSFLASASSCDKMTQFFTGKMPATAATTVALESHTVIQKLENSSLLTVLCCLLDVACSLLAFPCFLFLFLFCFLFFCFLYSVFCFLCPMFLVPCSLSAVPCLLLKVFTI